MSACPCHSEKKYASCCEPFHAGQAWPETAEALMRSRYSAYVLRKIDYLLKTRHPRHQETKERENIEKWANAVVFYKLEILNCSQGKVQDKTGKVEFKAHYKLNGEDGLIHERSRFKRYQGHWSYWDGEMLN
ncbi:SecC motif-containing protein [bacterium (Candidatus Blackallbacteria) CG17_big_fil_post_rev_8_21_14_2_50_48_46]|uniref:SecC motif-containing protein n=1 Tax=bacterium (Candidatus Blackallbacteria) CG17_big_fil_post_rev_8_21_14_2_50_48_46 TaxID=2014261 RepID=A0A2M7G3A2_9BACT|nr:MAG: SecC motif-containing protein [bacterium (Candidatus Blackallbacteria) CG18_big_fil_WC_8_21_14_2_50_49_26]PIW16312.1 MAG: SecC motif-containing protein [bacterium (Candidatus Blackallbacteria) CG17_big_fil_post_rev_8_21_14_2_50_48_46]PIW45326.1 MAG: SecC motif-containing protein [bacterium (Candidatus Blackallbacteria) CG13_big_fil_rev_8_21_14_2_50_49_14]